MTEELKIPAKKSRAKRRLKIALIAVGVFLVLLIASVEFTSTSKFCRTCHNMKPFYKSWQESTHKDVACKDCHYPPGLKSLVRTKMEGLVMLVKYATRLYGQSKPSVQISDEACLRPGCHDTRLLQGRVLYGKVVFDHTAHLQTQRRGEKLRCASCHAQIVQGQHMTVTATTCFLCHFKPALETGATTPPSDCALCHRRDELVDKAKSRFDHTPVYAASLSCATCHTKVVIGDGAVAKENCFKCHFEAERVAKYGETALIHTTHITNHKIDCVNCHAGIQHKIDRNPEAVADCRGCHQGTHATQKILYTGDGGKGTSHPVPNVMLLRGLNCQGCHILHRESGRLIKSGTSRSDPAVCETCHGKGYARILKNWERATEKRLAEARSVYADAAARIAGARNGRTQARALLEEAAFNIEVVEKGKAAHNMDYAQQLLAAALAKTGEALAAIGSRVKIEAPLILNQSAPNACGACHAGIEEISGPVFGLTFNHRSHLVQRKLPCADCHSNDKRHGELTASKASCAPCHHTPPRKKDCRACHELQKTIYKGGTWAGVAVPEDSMSQAGVACVDCHGQESKPIERPAAAVCVGCHGEESYKKTFEEQRAAVGKRVEELRAALHEAYRLPLSAERKTVRQKAEALLNAAQLDGSGGTHNAKFFSAALTAAVKEVRALSGLSFVQGPAKRP